MYSSAPPFFAREGRAHICIAIAAAAVAPFIIGWWALPVWAAAALVVQFFRDPPRIINQAKGVVVSPASGKIVFIGEVENPYAQTARDENAADNASDNNANNNGGRGDNAHHNNADRQATDNARAIKISVFMNIFSVHSNLIPIAGVIKNRRYYRGKFFNAALDKSSAHNERNAICIQTADGDEITCVQIAGFIARRILCYAQRGDTVVTGQRYGFIRFGSRVDVYLPLHTKLQVQLGQKVASGNDIIGVCIPARA